MAKAYNPEKTSTGEETMAKWRAKALTGDLKTDHPPGIGPATIKKLEDGGIDNTFKLLGMFFAGMPSVDIMEACQAFKNYLHTLKTPAGHQNTAVTGIAEKVYAGFRCPLEMSDDCIASSRANHEVVEAFVKKAKDGELSGNLAEDVLGISEYSAQLASVRGGMNTTWQMFGIALQCADAEELEVTLRDAGVSPAWSATVVHLVVEALNEGFKLPIPGWVPMDICSD